MAATSDFKLGPIYSEWTDPNAVQIATDNSGALYVLSTSSETVQPSSVTKISPDGKTIVWRNNLDFIAELMAVDANGGVYVAPAPNPDDNGSVSVAKLNASGSGIAWKVATGIQSPFEVNTRPPSLVVYLAADPAGRAYVAAQGYPGGTPLLVRLKADGSAIDYTRSLDDCPPHALAVDSDGAAFIGGYYGCLEKFQPDGSAGFHVVLDPGGLASDSHGGVWALNSTYDSSNGTFSPQGTAILRHFDSAGTLTASTYLSSNYGSLAADAAGNAYVAESSSGDMYPLAPASVLARPTKKNVAFCGSDLLHVFAPDGSLLQTTYIPGRNIQERSPVIVASANQSVYVLETYADMFAPTQDGPFTAPDGEPGNFIWSLSPGSQAPEMPFACMVNAAHFQGGLPISPGEVLALFGDGLGPKEGQLGLASLWTPFPSQIGDVEVTFDGTPAPLTWVQDKQINAVAPWSLTPGNNAEVCVLRGGVKLNCASFPVVQSSSGVYTVDGVHAAAINQDGTINSADHPAPPGSIVSVFATGLGPLAPPQADGALVLGPPFPTNALPAKVIQCIESPIEVNGGPLGAKLFFPGPKVPSEYIGPAPFLLAGTSQINFTVPATPEWGSFCVYVPVTNPGTDYDIPDGLVPFSIYVTGQ